MALRRELLGVALAAALALACLPGAALAAPQWVGGQTLDAEGGVPDVATDAGGNSAAVWIGPGGEVRAALRPHGGPWQSAEDLDPGVPAENQPPKIAALPGGEFVALWVGGEFGFEVRAARHPAGGGWSEPVQINRTCCPVLQDLVAGADGTALGFWTSEDGPAETAVRRPGNANWDAPQTLSSAADDTEVAVAVDGSAVAATPSTCADVSFRDCIRAEFRPAGGDWSDTTEIAGQSGEAVTGIALAARPGSSFTLVWTEGSPPLAVRGISPVHLVRSADRAGGSGRAWSSPQTVVEVLGGQAGCPTSFGCVDLASRGDTLAAVWQEGNEIAAALRTGGGAWGARERVGGVAGGDAFPQAAITLGGIAIAAWGETSGAAAAHAAHRGAGGGWSEEPLGRAAEGQAVVGDVVADGEGDGVTGWRDPADGTRATGFDALGPRFDTFSAPTPATTGATLPFSAHAVDNWSGLARLSWAFGDGGTAEGAAVNYAYANPGRYTATATATDSIGNASQSSGGVDVSPAPGKPPVLPPPCGIFGGDRDLDGVFDGCDTSDGSEAPKPFKTLNATVVSGEVFVKLPAGASRARAAAGAKAPKGFVRLVGAETIPMGSTLDTARGRVLLRTAKDTRRHVQLGQFSRGRFVVRQSRLRRGSRKLFTDLRLTGSSFAKACSGAKKATVSRRRSRKRVRRLFGDGKGNFRTRGRNAAATVRGTRWGVQDRCDGTLVTVQRGKVSVRDLVRRRTVLVRAGHTYLARRR